MYSYSQWHNSQGQYWAERTEVDLEREELFSENGYDVATTHFLTEGLERDLTSRHDWEWKPASGDAAYEALTANGAILDGEEMLVDVWSE